MKKNIINSFLFILIFILLSFNLNRVLVLGLKLRKGGEVKVWNDILGGDINADIIISGASRALTGVNCQQITDETDQSCYNIGLNGNHINLQLERLKIYFKYNSTPKVVVQVVGWSTSGKGEPFFPSKFVPYLDEEELYKSLVEVEPRFWGIKHIPLYSFSVLKVGPLLDSIQALFNVDKEEDVRYRGFAPVYKSWDNSFDIFKARNPNGVDIKIDHTKIELMKYLQKVVDVSKKNNTSIVIVYPPF